MNSELEKTFDLIYDMWPSDDETVDMEELLGVINNAIEQYADEPKLWIMKGDLIQYANLYEGDKKDEVMSCFRQALEIDSTNAEAWCEIGFLYDVSYEDFEKALHAFEKSLSLEKSANGYFGMARVLVQLGRVDEALMCIDKCPYSTEENIVNLKSEIQEGLWE